MATNQTTGPQAGADGSVTDLNERRETTYVILQQGENGGFWPVEGEAVTASSADRAIQDHLEARVEADDEFDPTGITFAAVPARSWNPRPCGGVEHVPAKRQFTFG